MLSVRECSYCHCRIGCGETLSAMKSCAQCSTDNCGITVDKSRYDVTSGLCFWCFSVGMLRVWFRRHACFGC